MHLVPSPARLDELISGMYAAAADRAGLASAVTAVAEAFKAPMAGIRIFDASHSDRHYMESIGLTPREWEHFDGSTAALNVWRQQGYFDLLRFGVGHSEMIMPVGELLRTDFYNEYLKPRGVAHGMGICLWSDGGHQMTAFSLNRGLEAGAFDSQELRLANRLLPHFRSAYALMRRLSWLDLKARSFSAALDRLHVGVLLVDGDLHVLYRNEVADAALTAREALMLSVGEQLRCLDPELQQHVRSTVALADAGKLPAPIRFPVRARDGKLRCFLVVSMLRGDFTLLCTPRKPCASLFVHAPPQKPSDAAQVLREAFGLTPAEARLAALLANGNSVAECTQVLGVSVTTVRSQLRRLLEKTATQRQAQLTAVFDSVLAMA